MLRDVEVQARSLEANLQDSLDTVGDLEMRVGGHEAMLAEKEKYIVDLEG